MRKPLLSLLLAVLALGVAAQQQKADSVEKILQGNLSLHDRAIKMKDLAMYYEIVDAKKSARLYEEAFEFTKRNKLAYEGAVVLQNKSFLITSLGDYGGAVKVLDSVVSILDGLKTPKSDSMMPKVYQVLSVNYRYGNDFKKAIEYTILSIAGFEKLKMYLMVIHSYYNLNNIYKDMDEPEKQVECGDKTLAIAKEWGGREGFFLGWLIKAYGHSAMKESDIKKAVVERDSALSYYDSAYSPRELIGYHLVSGLLYMNTNELDKARADFSRSLALAERGKDHYSVIQSRLQLSRVLARQKKFAEAEKELQSTEAEIGTEQVQRKNLLDYYTRLYEEWGKYKLALEYYGKFQVLKDSSASVENKKYLSEMATRYETEKKEAEIKAQKALLQKKDIVNYALVASVVVILVISLLIFRTYKQRQVLQRQRISELETEKQLTATESVLKGEEQERIRLAQDLHDGLGGMLSGIKYSLNTVKGNLVMTPDNAQAFDRSLDMLDSSIKEMRRVAHNMMPENLVKFGLDSALRDFCGEINQTGVLQVNYQSFGLEGGGVDQTTAITIYRIVQELINNTIKHAGAKTAIVQVAKAGDHLSVTVEDDGKGFDTAVLGQPKGIGLNNIQNRVEFLKGKMDVRSGDGKGTSVLIEISL
ncbi:MAG: tetratricopeptide repeat protein [Bacteroidetes bacterium]|nr:tetratricopeptide repeat protein [Bacteroidota bacterium]